MVEELQEFCHSVMLPWIVELAAILSFAYCCYHRGAEYIMYICLLCYNKPTESKFKTKTMLQYRPLKVREGLLK